MPNRVRKIFKKRRSRRQIGGINIKAMLPYAKRYAKNKLISEGKKYIKHKVCT